eukprot:evm.model.NODE_7313_length_17182_cov_38.694389.1
MSSLLNAMRPESAAPSPTNIEDANMIEMLRQDVLRKDEELASLQRAFEELQDSSQEIEKELEAELGRVEATIAHLMNDQAKQQTLIVSLQKSSKESTAEMERVAHERAEWQQRCDDLMTRKVDLETEFDTLETKLRVLEATEESLRHKAERLEEEKVYLLHEVDDLKAKGVEAEARLQQQLTEMSQDLIVMRMETEKRENKEEGYEEERIRRPLMEYGELSVTSATAAAAVAAAEETEKEKEKEAW